MGKRLLFRKMGIMLDLHNLGKKLTEKHSKSYLDMIIDSLIIAGITFFSTWSGKPFTYETVFMLIKATGLSFFIQLAYEKGIKRGEK